MFCCHGQYKFIETDSYASCADYALYDSNNIKVNLPENFQEAMKCPFLLNIHEGIITFAENNKIKQYFIPSKKEISILEYYSDIDGICGPEWSPDNKKIMFIIINQEHKHGYKEMCRIIVITRGSDGLPAEKKKFDLTINFECGSICTSSSGEDFCFVDNETIEYKRYTEIQKGPGTKVKISLQ
ncbi:MAG: hypothetical protein PHR81_08035 [Bacteroidales bacterium]|jgi:hypothetical protein|nr:hypothetical protein [Bacteroidales bacterium]MDD4214742.1 hypothetical protein [Bacteroidales bacterium]